MSRGFFMAMEDLWEWCGGGASLFPIEPACVGLPFETATARTAQLLQKPGKILALCR